jgi:DNA topoisomerase-1
VPTPRKKQPAAAAKKPAAKPRGTSSKAKPVAVESTGVAQVSNRKARPSDGQSAGRGYDLVIVESPAKAKTINKYLGSGFKVLASYGHVRDLATTKDRKTGEEVAGIRIADGWKLRYLVDAGARSKKRKGRRSQQDILNELGTAAEKANRVLLASDPDREGESIAWHIADELRLEPARTYRIRFNEITKNAVQQALSQAEKIDQKRVKAQEARRAMDRVVGFPLSKLLQDKVTMGLSAGRVQSVAVKLIVDREREIEAFKTEEYWKITALLAPQGAGIAWTADPAKSKVLAKKKGEPQPSESQGEPGASATGESDDQPPVADAPGSPAEKTGLPNPPPACSFLAELAKWDGQDVKAPTDEEKGSRLVIRSEPEADAIVAALQDVAYVITKIEQKDRQQRAPAPFTTSTLQIEANQRLRFSASRTMQTAQKLYEGVDLGSEGTVALITYMRTDSTRISGDALNAVRGYIDTSFGKPYLPEKPNFFASGKSAQEAHECIRPTDVSVTPQKAQALGLHGDQLRLYTLIWNRFVACQMMPAVYAVTSVEVTAGRGMFRASGRILKFDGFRRVLSPAGKQEDTELPVLNEQQPLDRLDLFETQHFTQPPPRFNEASLVKALEKEGIGRPSTYASIIETIQDRGYVEQNERRFFATEVGKVVTDLLTAHFPHIMDLKFTSHFEEELDDIETGKYRYEDVLNEFWGDFSQALETAREKMPSQRGIEAGENCPKCGRPLLIQFSKKTGNKFIGCSGWRDPESPCSFKKTTEGEEILGPEKTDIRCPACGKFMVRKEGRFGTFFTCEDAPNCPTTMNLGPDGKPHVTALPTKHRCPKCEKHNLLLKESKAGKKYLACPDSKCKFMADADAQGNPVKPADTGITCEKCGSPMVIKTSWRGPFLSCSGYPKCRNAKSINAELREKLKDILPPPPEKKAKPNTPQVEIAEKCPECGSAMRLQKSRFGGRYFLGCMKYPKCKGTMKLTPELETKVHAAEVAAATA